ncbi:YjfI family protein [Pseudomonas sp. NPDC089569]|uniref:YjfI family protein n=1 Tax=Pseudomonas sp. NPDC089569 TaxID=3390722 RepID=UPI003D04E8C6
MTENINWTIPTLYSALVELDLVQNNEITVEQTDSAQSALKLVMNEFGGQPIYIAISGDQILVEALLVEANQVRNRVEFNDAVLRSRDLFPLSSIGIKTLSSGDVVYDMFGALAAASSLHVVVHEVLTLATNVTSAVQALEHHFEI